MNTWKTMLMHKDTCASSISYVHSSLSWRADLASPHKANFLSRRFHYVVSDLHMILSIQTFGIWRDNSAFFLPFQDIILSFIQHIHKLLYSAFKKLKRTHFSKRQSSRIPRFNKIGCSLPIERNPVYMRE